MTIAIHPTITVMARMAMSPARNAKDTLDDAADGGTAAVLTLDSDHTVMLPTPEVVNRFGILRFGLDLRVIFVIKSTICITALIDSSALSMHRI